MKKIVFLFILLASLRSHADLAKFDSAVMASANENLVNPTAQLAAPVTLDGSQFVPFDFGAISNSATIEFILSGDSSATTSAVLAVGANSTWELRANQHNDNENMGYTHLGVEDYLSGVPSSDEAKYVVFRFIRNISIMEIYLDGLLASRDFAWEFQMPTGNGFVGARNASAASAMTGRIDRMIVHDSAIAPSVIRQHADAWLELSPALPQEGDFEPEAETYPAIMRQDTSIPTLLAEGGGLGIALEGKVAAISSPSWEEGGVRKGKVEIFVKNGPQWELRQRLIGRGPTSAGFHSNWGEAISLHDGLLVVGQTGFGNAPIEANLWGLIEFYT